MATHSSTSCLENPMDGGDWCRLLSMGLQRVSTTERLHYIHIYALGFYITLGRSKNEK